MDSEMEDQTLSFGMKDLNHMDKTDGHQSRERQKYSSSGFYDNHDDGHGRRSKERTNTDAKTDATITPFPVKKSHTFFSMRSMTIRSTQSTSEMIRRSKSRTSGKSIVVSDADNFNIHVHICVHVLILTAEEERCAIPLMMYVMAH
jgi:hypothetical protein